MLFRSSDSGTNGITIGDLGPEIHIKGTFSKEDAAKLRALGWKKDSTFGTFKMFGSDFIKKYGSDAFKLARDGKEIGVSLTDPAAKEAPKPVEAAPKAPKFSISDHPEFYDASIAHAADEGFVANRASEYGSDKPGSPHGTLFDKAGWEWDIKNKRWHMSNEKFLETYGRRSEEHTSELQSH